MKIYAIRKGRSTGIFYVWSRVEALVKDYPNAEYESFDNAGEAMAYLKEGLKKSKQQVDKKAESLQKTEQSQTKVEEKTAVITESKNTNKEANNTNTTQILKRKTVCINDIPREVGIAIDGDMLYGVINKTRFTWLYKDYKYPNVEVKAGSDKKKAEVYGRLFIMKRLELDNITLEFKKLERNIEYISLEEQDGVWLNAFANGYVRGAIHGIHFAWYPSKYHNAIALNQRGFKGSIKNIINTNEIIRRVRKSQYGSFEELFKAVNKKVGSNSNITSNALDSKNNAFAPKTNTTITTNIEPSKNFVYIQYTRDICIKYHENKSITGYINGSEFKWNIKDGMAKLPQAVRTAIKSNRFLTMSDVDCYYKKLFKSNNTKITNEISYSFKDSEYLQKFIIPIQDCEGNVTEIISELRDAIIKTKAAIDLFKLDKHEDLAILNSTLDYVNSFEILDEKLSAQVV